MECETAGIVRKRNQNQTAPRGGGFGVYSKMLAKVNAIWLSFAWHFLNPAN